ncbi:MAG: hypothetical protein LBL19_00070 [Spirochaetaceae bacterium]|jgi:hypothetical protein|nr:hypothetical protein [Spirochaetaceae bacterium]
MRKTSIMGILVLLCIAGTNVSAFGAKETSPPPAPEPKRSEPEIVFAPPPLYKTPLTIPLRQALSNDQLSKVQFYMSNSLTLTKEENKTTIKVDAQGRIIRTNGLESVQIRIPAETPGRLGQSNIDEYDILAVCFEDNNVNNYVVYFQPNEEKDRYELMFYSRDGIKLIRYGDTDYEISYSRELPYLQVVNEQEMDDTVNSRTVTGRNP